MQSLLEFMEHQLLELAVKKELPIGFSFATLRQAVAIKWANAFLRGDLATLLTEQKLSDGAKTKIFEAIDSWTDTSDTVVVADRFFIILEGGDLPNLPTLACIRSKLPKDRRPTEEELRKAFQECTQGTKGSSGKRLRYYGE